MEDWKCSQCGNNKLTGTYCSKCGIAAFNRCSGKQSKDDILEFPCSNLFLEISDRYCSKCGSISTFLEYGILKPWDYDENIIHETNLNFPLALADLNKLESLAETADSHAISGVNEYLHYLIYPTNLMLSDRVWLANIPDLSQKTAKLLTVLIKSYIDPLDYEIDKEGNIYAPNHPLGSPENQKMIRKIIDLALEQIDLIAPDPSK